MPANAQRTRLYRTVVQAIEDYCQEVGLPPPRIEGRSKHLMAVIDAHGRSYRATFSRRPAQPEIAAAHAVRHLRQQVNGRAK